MSDIEPIRSRVSSTGTARSSLKNLIVPRNPTLKVPDYTVTVYEPSQFSSVRSSGTESISNILNQLRNASSEFEIKDIDELIRTSGNIPKSARIIFGSGSESQVIDELDVEIGIENSRTQINKCASLKVLNPSRGRIRFMIPGNLVKIRLGYTATTNPVVFFGYIIDTGTDFEGGDLVVSVTMVPYVDGIISTVRENRYASMSVKISSSEDARPFSPERAQESRVNSGPFHTTSILDGLKYIIHEINDDIPDRFSIKLSINEEEFQLTNGYQQAQDAIVKDGSEGIIFTLPIASAKLSIKDVINAYIRQVILMTNKHTEYQIIWWLDGTEIRFPSGQSESYVQNNDVTGDKRLISVGSNAYKISGHFNVETDPDFSEGVTPVEDRSDEQQSESTETEGPFLFDVRTTTIRRIVIMAIGMPDISLGSIIEIREGNMITDSIQDQLGSLIEGGQVVNPEAVTIGDTDITDELWVVDAYEHIFSSDEAYRTRIRAVPAVVARDTNFRPSTPREDYKFTIEQDILRIVERFKQGMQGFSTPMRTDYVNQLIDGSELTSDEIKEKSIWASRDILIANTTDNLKYSIPDWNRFIEGDDDNAERRRYIATAGTNTSPWAMMYQSPKETGDRWIAAGVWFPKYRPFIKKNKYTSSSNQKPHYSQIQQRHLIHRIDNKLFLGMQDWSIADSGLKKTMVCYHTDYMIRTPARSVFLMPTSTVMKDVSDTETASGNQQSPTHSSHARGQKDGGTTTLISPSILMESNPLIKRQSSNFSPHLNRPSIKKLLRDMSSYTSTLVDTPTRSTAHASPIRYAWNTSDDHRAKNMTLLQYYRWIENDDRDDDPSDFVYRVPGMEMILDNDHNKDADDMSRVGLRKGDDTTPPTDSDTMSRIVQIFRDNRYTTETKNKDFSNISNRSSPPYEKDKMLIMDRQHRVESTNYGNARFQIINASEESSVREYNYFNADKAFPDYYVDMSATESDPTAGKFQKFNRIISSSEQQIYLGQSDLDATVEQYLDMDAVEKTTRVGHTDGTDTQSLDMDIANKIVKLTADGETTDSFNIIMDKDAGKITIQLDADTSIVMESGQISFNQGTKFVFGADVTVNGSLSVKEKGGSGGDITAASDIESSTKVISPVFSGP